MTNARTTYRENEVRGASPVRLVVLLYEQLVQDLLEAMRALEQNDIALRTEHINHAILVIGHLQSALDFEKGERPARVLDTFYDTLRQNLVEAQFFPSKESLQRQITDLLSLRAAWLDVEQAETHPAPPAAPVGCTPATEAEVGRVDWEG